MPLVNVKIIEGVFSPQQKHEIIEKLTEAMVSIEGETCAASPGSSSRRC
jgi:4-oxalocrotonate tautomerase